MENFTLKGIYFYLVVFFFKFYFIQNINVSHTFKSIKMPIIGIYEGLPYFFINDAG